MSNDIEAERKSFADAYREKLPPFKNYSDDEICIRCAPDQFTGWQMARRAALAAPQQIPELRNLGKVTRTGDQSIRLEFSSCRSASVFEKFIRSAPLPPAANSSNISSSSEAPADPALSDEEIRELAMPHFSDDYGFWENELSFSNILAFARALLAKVTKP